MSFNPQQIADKLERLRAMDQGCQLFGVDEHRYRLGPRMSLREIETIETQYGIRLPEDYRAFLVHIGNGGAGPGLGLQRFGWADTVAEIPTATPRGPLRQIQTSRNRTLFAQDLFDAHGQKVDPFAVSFFDTIKELARDGVCGPNAPRQPFPLSGPFPESRSNSGISWGDIDPSIGTLRLADYGCAMTAQLVLNGRFRDQVWFYDPNAEAYTPFGQRANIHYPEQEEPTKRDARAHFTFSSWYEHWIDHALEQLPDE